MHCRSIDIVVHVGNALIADLEVAFCIRLASMTLCIPVP